MSLFMYILFGLSIFGILLLCYDAWNHSVQDWFDDKHVGVPYPWWVRLNHWIYHTEQCRIGDVSYEHHIWFNTFKSVGRPLAFILKG